MKSQLKVLRLYWVLSTNKMQKRPPLSGFLYFLSVLFSLFPYVYCQSGSVRFVGVVLPFSLIPTQSSLSVVPGGYMSSVIPSSWNWHLWAWSRASRQWLCPGNATHSPLLLRHETVDASGLECKQNTPLPPRWQENTTLVLVCRLGCDLTHLDSVTQKLTLLRSWLREFIIEPVWFNQIHIGLLPPLLPITRPAFQRGTVSVWPRLAGPATINLDWYIS